MTESINLKKASAKQDALELLMDLDFSNTSIEEMSNTLTEKNKKEYVEVLRSISSTDFTSYLALNRKNIIDYQSRIEELQNLERVKNDAKNSTNS